MPAYRRFVTYLFQYNDGKKGRNCGFAKVEARRENCRIEVQIKGEAEKRMPVYLLAGSAERPLGVLIGGMEISAGLGTAVFAMPAGGIGGTPYGIDAMRGLYLPAGEGRFIASQWDDQDTDWTAFVPYEDSIKSEEKNRPMQTEKAPGKRAEPGETDLPQTQKAAGQPENAEGHAAERHEASQSGQRRTDAHPENAGRHGAERHEASQSGQQKADTRMESAGSHEAERHEAARSGQKRTDAHPKTERGEDLSTEQKAEEQAAGQSENAESHEAEKPELKATQAAAALQYPYDLAQGWRQQWQRFTAAHPVFCPFDEDEGVYGVRFNLRDFKVLPRMFQSLANNSFLLHGYFNYHYILFGYVDGEKKRWFVGIPGVFQNQEQLLAGIFGFPEFRTKQLTRQKTGEFGYWCRFLDLEE